MSEDLTILTHPVHDIDGREIAPAGAVVGRSLLSAVAAGGAGGGEIELGDTDVPEDLALFAGEAELMPLFGSEITQRIQGLAGRIRMPDPVWRELQAMREQLPVFYHHSLATTAIVMRLTLEVTVKTDELVRIGRATLLKDLGMTRIPRELTRNRDYLSRQEFFQISKHPILGLLLNTWYFGEGLEGMVALRHHMRNGAGYPRWGQLRPSRLMDIIEAVDVFYALISPRPFRPEPYDVRGALDELTGMVERGEIGADALKLLISGFREDKPNLREVEPSGERQGFVPESNFYGIADA